jgi:membrane protein
MPKKRQRETIVNASQQQLTNGTNYMKRFWKALASAALQFNRNDGWAHSSHIALSLLMALFPFCIFSLSLAGQLSSNLNSSDLVTFVFGAWPDQIAEPIEREIEAVLASSDTTKMTVSGLFAIFFASNGVDAIRTAITGAYRETDPRPFWKARLLCVVFVILGSGLLIVAGALTVALPLYFYFVEVAAPSVYARVFSSEIIRGGIIVALLIFLLVAFHMWLPGLKRPLRSVMPGVFLTLVSWIICAQGFSIYIKNFATYSVTYAGLAGTIAALVFMYLMAALFIFGAEFNGELYDDVADDVADDVPPD